MGGGDGAKGRTWLGEKIARVDNLEESLDQKGGRMAKGAPAREKQGSAEEGQGYRTQEEWIKEEMRRHRQQTKRDQNKQTRDQGRGENWNQIPSSTEKNDTRPTRLRGRGGATKSARTKLPG